MVEGMVYYYGGMLTWMLLSDMQNYGLREGLKLNKPFSLVVEGYSKWETWDWERWLCVMEFSDGSEFLLLSQLATSCHRTFGV